MDERSNEKLAVDLTIATLNHNAQLHNANSQSKDLVVNGVAVAKEYFYLLQVINGKCNPFEKPGE